MKTDVLIEIARRDRWVQREIRKIVRARGLGRTLRRLTSAGPAGPIALWSGIGKGRLRFARPVPSVVHPPIRGVVQGSGGREVALGLPFHDAYWTLGNTPLLYWRQNDCPSCMQLVRAAARRPEEVETFTAAIRALTRDRVTANLTGALPALRWLFSLLPVGFYLVSLDDYYPTAGGEHPSWGAFDALGDCVSIREAFAPAPPKYLIPTQRSAAFRPDAWQRARATFRSHPGIALHLGGLGSALLDGHHRSLAAAEARETFTCITVTPGEVFHSSPKPGQPCPVAPEPAVVRFGSSGVVLPAGQVPSILRVFLHVRLSSRHTRWLVDGQDRRAIEARLAERAEESADFPEVSVRGAYPSCDDQPERPDLSPEPPEEEESSP